MTGGRERSDRRLSSTVQISVFAFFMLLALVLPFVPPARAATVNVSIVNFAYQPDSINIQIGDTVIWTNNGGAIHTVTSDGGSGPLDSGDIASGNTYSHTFSAAGTYNYHCTHHPSMTASVTVGSVIPEYSSSALVAFGFMALFLCLIALGRKR